MKSYKITESEKPLVEINHETPIPVGKQVLVKTIACGVCHSDIHIHDGFLMVEMETKYPQDFKIILQWGMKFMVS